MNQLIPKATILDQLQNFAGQLNGNPQDLVNQYVQEKGVSNEDYNRVVQGAKAFMQQFGLK